MTENDENHFRLPYSRDALTDFGITPKIRGFMCLSEDLLQIRFFQEENSAFGRFDFNRTGHKNVNMDISNGALTVNITDKKLIRTARVLHLFNKNSLLTFVSDKACGDIRRPLAARIINRDIRT